MRSNLIKRLRNPAFFTETSERNLMNEAADALEEYEKKAEECLILTRGIASGMLRLMKERDAYKAMYHQAEYKLSQERSE